MKSVVLLLVAFLHIAPLSACVLFNKDAALGSNSNAPPVPVGTLQPGDRSVTTSNMIEQLRLEMHEASLSAARERHPASKLVGDGCTEISFVLLESKGGDTQYIGLYRCTMKGAILGINSYDFQVDVIGEVKNENGTYTKRIVSAK